MFLPALQIIENTKCTVTNTVFIFADFTESITIINYKTYVYLDIRHHFLGTPWEVPKLTYIYHAILDHSQKESGPALPTVETKSQELFIGPHLDFPGCGKSPNGAKILNLV